MYAVNTAGYKIWFGGSYKEHWSDDYTLSIEYTGRRAVEARFTGGRWHAAGGDAELCALLESEHCPKLTREYFEAAATAYSAAQDCLRRGLTLDRLGEHFRSEGNPLVAPELMRLLMDDCGFSMNVAYNVAAHTCADIRADGIDTESVYQLQPRTAHVISLLRSAAASMLAVAYDSRREEFRRPSGALRCGDELRLAFRVLSGCVRAAALVLCSDGGRMEYPMRREGQDYAVSFVPSEKPQALWYFFRIETEEGTHWLCPDGTGFIGRIYGRENGAFRLTVAMRQFDTPEWFRHGIMYQIFPDRFAFSDDDTARRGIEYHRALRQTPELHANLDEPVRWQPRPFEKSYSPDDFYGGTLRGIEQKLPYLQELGINVIYLNPIVEARSNHRYDASDYMRPDPILGTTDDFERLAAEAAKRGIRIILDGVFSHTGADSVYFNRYGNYKTAGACQGPESEFYSWYDFRQFPDDYRCWWGFKDLPEVNEMNPDWEKFVVTGENSVVKTWLRRGSSGWRLDVADELPDDFIAAIRTAIGREKADAYLLGEVWEDGSNKIAYSRRRRYLLGRETHGLMNYPFRTALLAWLGGGDAAAFRDAMESIRENYPPAAFYGAMNFLGTHDTARILTLLGADETPADKSARAAYRLSPAELERGQKKLRLAGMLLYSFPGSPTLYYGDEAGMQGFEDPLNRGTYPWGREDELLLAFFQRLGQLRAERSSLRRGGIRYLYAQGGGLVIERRCGGERTVTALNAGGQVLTLTLDWDGPLCRDGVTGQQFLVQDGRLRLTLPPLDGVVLV